MFQVQQDQRVFESNTLKAIPEKKKFCDVFTVSNGEIGAAEQRGMQFDVLFSRHIAFVSLRLSRDLRLLVKPWWSSSTDTLN